MFVENELALRATAKDYWIGATEGKVLSLGKGAYNVDIILLT